MIYFLEDTKTFYLESKNVTYAFCVNEAGFLQHLYFGKRIHREDLTFAPCQHTGWRIHGTYLKKNGKMFNMNAYPNECPTYGRSDYRESMIALDFNGVRVGDFEFEGYEILSEKPPICGMPSVKGKETLRVCLFDALHKVKVYLYYTVFEEFPVIIRHAEIVNESNQMVKIDRAYSFAVDYPEKKWEAITLFGAHGRERMVERTKLSHGVYCVDSKRGVSSAQMNPFLAIVDKYTNEDTGEAYGYNLVYSGNFAFKVQMAESDGIRVVGGINDYDFCWELHAGETFVTPEAVLVYSNQGLGQMSRSFHDLYRKYLINQKYVSLARPIVINNWEATRYDFDMKKLCAMIDSVKGTGIDTFVLDDGWFGGENPRNNELVAMGDWIVAEEKINLKELIDYTHQAGLKFGLWFEPEMIGRNSEIFREHPEYALHVDGLTLCEGRWEFVLDLTNKEVRDWIVGSVSSILKEYQIDYVKWDMNRSLTEFSSVFNKETAHRYVLGLYEILERLVNEYPNLLFEGCASGGCRFDPAMLYYFPQIWTSDNTDVYMRSCIQYGTSFCYPLSSMSCHVSVSPNHQCGRMSPFSSRANIASLGAFGYELDTTKLTADEFLEIKEQIKRYKEIEQLVLDGDLYRLNSPFEENLFAEQIVSKEKDFAMITVFKPISVHNEDTIRVYPKGLLADATYHVEELDIMRKGDTLMGIGLLVSLPKQDFQSTVFHLKRVNAE